jgi:hypothetical protein
MKTGGTIGRAIPSLAALPGGVAAGDRALAGVDRRLHGGAHRRSEHEDPFQGAPHGTLAAYDLTKLESSRRCARRRGAPRAPR